MSAMNRETKKVAMKNVKDDVNNVLKNASSHREKIIKPKQQEIPDTKDILVSFYDKMIHESMKTSNKEQLQRKAYEMTTSPYRQKPKETKAAHRKTQRKGSELVIPCTNDLCAKVRQLVEMNAEVQRFRKKFLEVPVEPDKKTLHQKKIDIGNQYSKKNLTAFKKTNSKSMKFKETPTYRKSQMQGQKNVGWNPQTLITPEVLGSSSNESLLALSIEVETSSSRNDHCDIDKDSCRSLHSLYQKIPTSLRKMSREMECESEYVTCMEDNNQDSQMAVRRTPSAKMLTHFRQLLDQHTLQKDKEKVRTSMLNEDEVSFLKNLVEADERYRLLERDDHKFLKEVLKYQLRQIETQERILEEALKMLREKTGSGESVTLEKSKPKITRLTQLPENMPLETTYDCGTSNQLDLGNLVINMFSDDDSKENNNIEEDCMMTYRTYASTVRSARKSDFQDALANVEDCKSPTTNELNEVPLSPLKAMRVTSEMLTSNRDMQSHVPSITSILGIRDTNTPVTPPTTPTQLSSEFASCQNSDITIQTKPISNAETIRQPLLPSEIFLGSSTSALAPQNVVPPLNLDSINTEPTLESAKVDRQVYTSPGRIANDEDKNPGIQVIFKNITSPQKEIQLLKAISARLEKTFEKTGTTYAWVKSIEVNLNDDSEKAASAVRATESFPEIKINDSPMKNDEDGSDTGEHLDAIKEESTSYLKYEATIAYENESVEPQKVEVSESKTYFKMVFLIGTVEYYSFREELSISFIIPLKITSTMWLVKEFKVKYLSLEEMESAGDFYIVRPEMEIFEPEKTNFEQLQANPAKFAKLLTPRFEENDMVKDSGVVEKKVQDTSSQTNIFKGPDEAVIKRVICCLFKTWATYPELYLYSQAIPPTIWNSKYEETCNGKELLEGGHGDCNVAEDQIPSSQHDSSSATTIPSSNALSNHNMESLPYGECASPHWHNQTLEETCICQRNCQYLNELDILLDKRKRIANWVVFVAQFVLFVLLVISLSMPDYLCLKF